MKRFMCLLTVLLCSIILKAQTRIKAEDIEVKDSSGMVYPTAIWQKLMSTGHYTVRIMSDGKTGLLVRLSEEEIAKRFAKLPKPTESKFFRTGEKITSFNERDMNGNKYNLKELAAAGKVVVLNFWFVNCPPCRQEIPQLNELVQTYKDNKDVVFIAVALDQAYDIKEFLKSSPYQYNIIDNGRYIASKYNITLYPTHAVVNREGKVIFHTSGLTMSTVGWVKKSIEAALNNTVPQ